MKDKIYMSLAVIIMTAMILIAYAIGYSNGHGYVIHKYSSSIDSAMKVSAEADSLAWAEIKRGRQLVKELKKMKAEGKLKCL